LGIFSLTNIKDSRAGGHLENTQPDTKIDQKAFTGKLKAMLENTLTDSKHQ